VRNLLKEKIKNPSLANPNGFIPISQNKNPKKLLFGFCF